MIHQISSHDIDLRLNMIDQNMIHQKIYIYIHINMIHRISSHAIVRGRGLGHPFAEIIQQAGEVRGSIKTILGL